MSVEANELMSEVWTRWQGHVIHDVFPLGRYLGCSDHSGVFLSRSPAPGPAEVAVKLVPTDRALAESLLPRWKKAAGIVHPHLLGLLQSGGCQLDGLPYLYVVMEYADQTLAQVLESRALTDEEAREMLRPTLDALAFLHDLNLVHGQLKPTNILVVGNQLKLASDTMRRVTEGPLSAKALTVYDPPEALHRSSSTAGDIWALGVCLYEALTRRLPSGRGERSEAVALPSDFSPAFRDVVARCLSPSPQNRPSVTELVAWASGPPTGPAPDATIQPVAIVRLEPAAPEPTAPKPTPARITIPPAAPEAAKATPSMALSTRPRALHAAVLGGIAILALGWTGMRMLRSQGASSPLQTPEGSLSQTQGAIAPMARDARKSLATVSPPKPGRSSLATSPSALHEEIPEISQGARRTIIGHIKIWIRVIVDQDGSVYAATADRSGPSRYFRRLSIEAAKKWTFPPINTQSQRLMQIRFDFSRDGTTGRAVTIR
jgi:tRNA A-37 threonylcarbamoyl transferase component Bud32